MLDAYSTAWGKWPLWYVMTTTLLQCAVGQAGRLTAAAAVMYYFFFHYFGLDVPDYVFALAIGIVSAALPQYLFVKGTPLAGAGNTASLSSLEIVVAMLMSVLVLGQQFDRIQVSAAILIVIAQLIREEVESPCPKASRSHRVE